MGGVPTLENLISAAGASASRSLVMGRICRVLRRQAGTFGSGPRSIECIDVLQNTDSAAIMAVLPAGLFGGTLSSLWSCVTLLKIASKVAEAGVRLIPILALKSDPIHDGRMFHARILDEDGNLVDIRRNHQQSRGDSEGQIVTNVETTTLISDLTRILGRNADESLLELLRRCCRPGRPAPAEAGTFFAELFREKGLVILDTTDPDFKDAWEPTSEVDDLLRQQAARLRRMGYLEQVSGAVEPEGQTSLLLFRVRSLLPVACFVTGPEQITDFALCQMLSAKFEMTRPVIFPRCSATLVDARSRNVLERHGLGFATLFKGPSEILSGLAVRRDAGHAIEDLAIQEQRTREMLEAAAQRTEPDEKTRLSIRESEERICYQLARLRERLAGALARRLDASERQITRACNLLAPSGDLQERQLSAVYFLSRYSHNLAQIIENKIDVWKFEHLLLPME